MKRFLLKTALIALAICPPLFAQNLRQNVCIVKEQFSQQTQDWLKETGEYLSQKGYSKYASAVKELDGATSGSGFVYVAANGKNYIITNRHVVSSAEHATIQFEKPDGTYTTYENLKVVATDKDLDLALLEFENGQNPFKSGLPIAKTAVSDGEEIWTAGFPGLAGNPSWQLGKGNVTNASTRLKELVDPNVSLLIQHSAPVDPGNSGGPLLRQRGGAYEVVGVNTWKVSWRQSTNLSMPASALQRFIQQGTNTKSATLNDRVKSFCQELSAEEISFNNVEKFIAKDYARQYGAEYFVSALRTAGSAERAFVVLSFESSPMNGFNAAVAVNALRTLLKDDFAKDCKIEQTQKQEDGTYKVELANQDKTIATIWKQENASNGGQWCLCGFEEETQSKEKSSSKNSSTKKSATSSKEKSKNNSAFSGFEFEKPYTVCVGAGYMNAGTDKNCFGIKANFAPINFISVQIELDFARFEEAAKPIVSPGVRANLPLNFEKFFLMPYGVAGFNMAFGSFGIGFFGGGGLEAGYKFDRFQIFAFGEFTYKKVTFKENFEDQEFSRAAPSFGLGVAFEY